MNLLQIVQLGTHLFIKHAYSQGLPERIRDIIHELQGLRSSDDLLNWKALEKENCRYSLRLGNQNYPHMKLVFMLSGGEPVLYVDSHDSHFEVPENTPGYDGLLQLRQVNHKLKLEIEAAWTAERLPLFGRQPTAVFSSSACTGLRVLVIDDEIQILDMMGIIVSSLGATMIRALSAEEARASIKSGVHPDVIFCDIMMPGESGYEFAAWLKSSFDEHVPIYYITGMVQEKVDRRLAEKVLQKPFTAKAVIAILKSRIATA